MGHAERTLSAIVKGVLQFPADCFVESIEKPSAEEIKWLIIHGEACERLPNTRERIFWCRNTKSSDF